MQITGKRFLVIAALIALLHLLPWTVNRISTQIQDTKLTEPQCIKAVTTNCKFHGKMYGYVEMPKARFDLEAFQQAAKDTGITYFIVDAPDRSLVDAGTPQIAIWVELDNDPKVSSVWQNYNKIASKTKIAEQVAKECASAKETLDKIRNSVEYLSDDYLPRTLARGAEIQVLKALKTLDCP